MLNFEHKIQYNTKYGKFLVFLALLKKEESIILTICKTIFEVPIQPYLQPIFYPILTVKSDLKKIGL